MYGVIFGMACAILALVAILYLLVVRNNDLSYDIDDELDAAHAKCIAHIASVVSDRMVAVVLRDLARRYESIEEKPTMLKISRQYKQDGPSMPRMWMEHHADLLDPPTTEHQHVVVRRMDGSYGSCCDPKEMT